MWILGGTALLGVCLFLVGAWVWSDSHRAGIQDTGSARSVTFCGTILGVGGGVMLSLHWHGITV